MGRGGWVEFPLKINSRFPTEISAGTIGIDGTTTTNKKPPTAHDNEPYTGSRHGGTRKQDSIAEAALPPSPAATNAAWGTKRASCKATSSRDGRREQDHRSSSPGWQNTP